MKLEDLEVIQEQVEAMQDAFNTLDDCCYQISRVLSNEINSHKTD